MKRITPALLVLASILAGAGSPSRADVRDWIVPPLEASLLQGKAVNPTSQVLMGTTGTVSGTQTRFFAVGYTSSRTPVSTDTIPYSYMPFAGTISGVRATQTLTSTTGNLYTVTLFKNGVSAGISCQLTTTTSCSGTGSVTVAAGDLISWQFAPTGNPVTGMTVTVATVLTPTVAGNTVIFTNIASPSNSTTQAVMPFSDYNPGAVSVKVLNTLPDSGTIDQLFVDSTVAPGGSASYAYSVDKNTSATTLTTTVSASATTGSDATHSFTVAGPTGASCAAAATVANCTPGDNLQFVSTPTGTPTSPATTAYSVRYVPTTSRAYPLMAVRLGDNTTSTFYYPMSTTATGFTSEGAAQQVSYSQTITKITARMDVAPGTGKSRVFTLRQNGVSTGLSCSIQDTATACAATGTVTVVDGDMLDTQMVPSGTPATGTPTVSYLATR